MEHERLRYNFFFAKVGRTVYVVPEGKTGGPNAVSIGSFRLEEGDTREYAEYEDKLMDELEATLNTIPDEDFTTYTIKIHDWKDEVHIIEPTNPIAEDPIDKDLPVPVSDEIRAEAKGIAPEM